MKEAKRLYFVYILAAVMVCFTSPAFSQKATLTGTVTDSETGEALPGANVVVRSVTVQTGGATDNSGNYEVRSLAPGAYTVVASYIGYEKQTMTNIVFTASETRNLDFFLNPTGIQVNPISISASRRPEKVLEAPASVFVLDVEQIAARPVLTATEHLKATPGVDIVQTGMNQSNVVVRGFNNIFSGALLSLVDNRILRVPGLRFNAYNFTPTANEDIERFEVVLGPAAALYGPGAASGVFHMITKSPIGSEGTTVSIGGGERDLFMGSFRHAGSVNDKFGYKVSFQYYQATDWKFNDPAEPDSIVKFRPTTTGPMPITGLIPNDRNFDIEKIATDIRLDYRFTDETSFILSGGFNQANSIELTGIGAGQAVDWRYNYIQARFNYKDLYLQAFVNSSDAGDTFILRSGQLIIDTSKLLVGQIQHGAKLGERQRFTYGFDALLTRPDTDNTVNGRNEDNDNIDELGIYLQSETDLTSKLRLVLAGRIDDHSELEDPIFSPRAALVFKPTPTDNFRVTFNRAFSTPTALNLSLDLLQAPDPFGLGAFQQALGVPFATNIDIRAQGVPRTGFNFRQGANGGFQFRSPFAPLDPRGLNAASFIDMHDPIFTNVMWSIGSGAVSSQFVPQYVAGLIASGFFDPATAQILGEQFLSIVPAQVGGVNNVLMSLDPELAAAGAANPFFADTPFDVPRIKEETTQTFEFGYKGVLGEKLVVGVDAYFTEIQDFISPLLVVTPSVFLDPATLIATVGPQFGAALADPNNATLNATLVGALDPTARGGNGNGSAVDELTALYVGGAAGIPFGTVTPQEAFDPNALIVTYRNFGEVNFWGLDLNFTYFINNMWALGGNYSYVSQDLFKNLDGIDDIALNSPQHKFGANLNYRNRESGFDANLRLRFADSFPVKTATFAGMSDRFAVLDLATNYKLPFSRATNLNLTIQNLTNNKHREIIGAPLIGRLGIVRITQSF